MRPRSARKRVVSVADFTVRIEAEGFFLIELAVSPSLVQNLKTNTVGVREVSSKVLDIVIWPFRYTTSLVLSDSEDEDEDEEEEKRNAGPPVDSDELKLAEKRTVAMRLLALVSSKAHCGFVLD